METSCPVRSNPQTVTATSAPRHRACADPHGDQLLRRAPADRAHQHLADVRSDLGEPLVVQGDHAGVAQYRDAGIAMLLADSSTCRGGGVAISCPHCESPALNSRTPLRPKRLMYAIASTSPVPDAASPTPKVNSSNRIVRSIAMVDLESWWP
jgi:hypothetical protein